MKNGKALQDQTNEIVQQIEFMNKNLNTIAANQTMIFQKLDEIKNSITKDKDDK